MKEQTYTTTELLKMEPLQLHEYLTAKYCVKIPSTIETAEDLRLAQAGISRAATYYAFLESMRESANLQKSIFKEAAQLAEDKEEKKQYQAEFNTMLKREQIFESASKILDRIYQAISRLVTIKQQMNQEINMSGKA